MLIWMQIFIRGTLSAAKLFWAGKTYHEASGFPDVTERPRLAWGVIKQ